RDFIRSIIDAAARFNAPTVVGSMRGRWTAPIDRDTAMSYLRDALTDLGQHAKSQKVPLLFEPLNRYETNLLSRVYEGIQFIRSRETDNVQLRAALFDLNIEEQNPAVAIRAVGPPLGHIHFVDPNRRPIGCGHPDVASIATVLREIGYD